MITKEQIGDELYVYIYVLGRKCLLYKRWISKGYGVIMDRQPFTAKDVAVYESELAEDTKQIYNTLNKTNKTMKEIEFNLTFGEATEAAVKRKEKIARKGWNGKGMYLVYFSPVANGMEMLSVEGAPALPLLPFLLMKTADDKLVPWLASQTDVLATDWGIVTLN